MTIYNWKVSESEFLLAGRKNRDVGGRLACVSPPLQWFQEIGTEGLRADMAEVMGRETLRESQVIPAGPRLVSDGPVYRAGLVNAAASGGTDFNRATEGVNVMQPRYASFGPQRI